MFLNNLFLKRFSDKDKKSYLINQNTPKWLNMQKKTWSNLENVVFLSKFYSLYFERY